MSRKAAIMIQGTGSNVGKSLIVAGLCRAFVRRGLVVRPFKPQNMSNNAAAVVGGEIGRAQALQARGACVTPSVDMNPVLLKPETDRRSQVIVRGQRVGQLESSGFRERENLLPVVLESFSRLEAEADIVVVEGAGSPAETNLRRRDIANMGFAVAAGVPVVLAGDIDRGGVIASLIGTNVVLDDMDRRHIKGFFINKFRGDATLFADGMTTVASATGWAPLGIVPWFREAARLPAEDAVDLELPHAARDGQIVIAVPMLSRIANFDDFDPLKLEPSVRLVMVPPGKPLPGNADLVILPGTKATIADMQFFRSQGWDIDLVAHMRRGGHVLGICGGYQMLGRTIRDPERLEGGPTECEGLGLLDVETTMGAAKEVRTVSASHVDSRHSVSAYEIHMGRTHGPDCERGGFELEGAREGASSSDGRVTGTYLHGLFSSDAFRAAWLARFGLGQSTLRYEPMVEETLDGLAAHLEEYLDLDTMLAIAKARM